MHQFCEIGVALFLLPNSFKLLIVQCSYKRPSLVCSAHLQERSDEICQNVLPRAAFLHLLVCLTPPWRFRLRPHQAVAQWGGTQVRRHKILAREIEMSY